MDSKYDYIDIAFNPTFYKTPEELDNVIDSALINSKCCPVFIGTESKTNKQVFELAYKKKLYCYVGLHPNDITEKTSIEEEIAEIKNLLTLDVENRIVGIGECGVDTFRSPGEESLKRQLKYFKMILDEFKCYNLPFFLHLRESSERKCSTEFLELLNKCNCHKSINNSITAVVHSFTSNVNVMKELLKLRNCYVGLNGISFKENIEIGREIPLDRVLIETDSPFCLIRKSWAGAKFVTKIIKSSNNRPEYITQVCEVLAKIKGENVEIVRKIVLLNTLKVFKRILP